MLLFCKYWHNQQLIESAITIMQKIFWLTSEIIIANCVYYKSLIIGLIHFIYMQKKFQYCKFMLFLSFVEKPVVFLC